MQSEISYERPPMSMRTDGRLCAVFGAAPFSLHPQGISRFQCTRPSVGQAHESQSFQDWPAGGQSIHDQVTSTEPCCISCAGRNRRSVSATATMLFERSSAVQTSESTLWMSIQSADTYRDVPIDHHITAVLCRAFPYA